MPRPSFSSSLRDPLAAGHAQSCLAPDQQAPHRKEEHGEDAGFFRIGSQQPFDEADGCQQSTKLLSGHRRLSGNGFVQIDWLQTQREDSQPGLRAKEAKALSGLPRSISTEELDCLN